MASEPVSYISPEDYLALERASETKHEYIYGEMVAMAGGSPRHALIIASIIGALRAQLSGRHCFVFSSDLRVAVRWGELITYPDVTVLCGTPAYTDDRRDTLTNATFVAEVLSPSTKSFDRGEKGRLYRMMPSLREYLIVDQESIDIEHWRRLPNENWELATIRDRSATFNLESLGCSIPVAEIYGDAERLG